MNELSRYRVTGGVFLIALAVIVLPMLFDAQGVDPQPLAPLDATDYPDDPPGGNLLGPNPVGPNPVDLETEIDQLELNEAALSDAESLRESVDEQGFARDTGTRIGEVVIRPAGRDAESAGVVWGVQLASFAERQNAVALRDQLQADGYPALLSDVKRLTGQSTRVAIGPLLSREEASALRQELTRRYELNAIVVRLGS